MKTIITNPDGFRIVVLLQEKAKKAGFSFIFNDYEHITVENESEVDDKMKILRFGSAEEAYGFFRGLEYAKETV